MPSISPRSQKLDLRLTPQAKSRLQAAAVAAQRSVSEFVLESALSRADAETAPVAKPVVKTVPAIAVAALDAPPRDLPRLTKLLNTPGPFDSSAF